LDSYESVENCIRALKGKKSVLIIGAGAIGIEVAFAVKSLGIDVTVAEARGQIAPLAFDPEIASQVEEQMRAKGINLLLNAKVEKLENNSAYINGSAVSAELIVLATGVRSNHALAEKAGLRIGKFGIAVDEFLKTSDKDIYACGDCAEAFNFITKQPANAKLATVAYLQGICAGINAAGGRKKYIGTLCTFVSKFSTYEIASTGLTENYAKELGHDVISAKVNATAKPEAFPENNKILLKLVVDKKSRKILGCQAAGFGSTERINLVAQAIYAGISLEQLLDYENAYCPSVSKTFDLLKVCAELCVRKLNL
jgi:NADH oxidase (H2O2-forming)